MKNIETLAQEFDPEQFTGDLKVLDSLEEVFKKKFVKNKYDYLIVKRPLGKQIAIKRVSLMEEEILDKYIEEVDIFIKKKMYQHVNRVVLLFEKDGVTREDIEELKECIIFDKFKRAIFESIEVVLIDNMEGIVYFDGLKDKSTCFKYFDTRKMLINEMEFSIQEC